VTQPGHRKESRGKKPNCESVKRSRTVALERLGTRARETRQRWGGIAAKEANDRNLERAPLNTIIRHGETSRGGVPEKS